MRSLISIRAMAKAGWQDRLFYSLAGLDAKLLCDHNGWNLDRFLDVLAITSIRSHVAKNIRLTLVYMSQAGSDGLWGDYIDKLPTIGLIKEKLHRMERGEKLTGPKIVPFRNALAGDETAIVIDSHIIRAFGCGTMKPTKGERKTIIRDILRLSREYDCSPRESQAAVWSGWRQFEGWNPSQFDILERARQCGLY